MKRICQLFFGLITFITVAAFSSLNNLDKRTAILCEKGWKALRFEQCSYWEYSMMCCKKRVAVHKGLIFKPNFEMLIEQPSGDLLSANWEWKNEGSDSLILMFPTNDMFAYLDIETNELSLCTLDEPKITIHRIYRRLNDTIWDIELTAEEMERKFCTTITDSTDFKE